MGVLQTEKIRFSPAIPEKIDAARKLGYGPVIKTMLQFNSIFWSDKELTQQKDLSRLSFIFSEAIVPTWWTQYPDKYAILTGWSGGPYAEELKDLSIEDILKRALDSLSSIFNLTSIHLHQQLQGWHVCNWATDPFSCGAYSYDVVNGKKLRKIVKEPLGNTVFFAGEAFYEGSEIGTVEAALVNGRETAFQVVASLKKKT
jgi:monoamine oxidase